MRLRLHMPVERQQVQRAQQFGRVAVLYGGSSSEREVSLISGKAVLAALLRREVAAVGFDPAQVPLTDLAPMGVERVWIALHGPGGEDGTVQGALDVWACPTAAVACSDPLWAWTRCVPSVSRKPWACRPRSTECSLTSTICPSRSSGSACP